ncbi:MAG: hypothetical protein GX855_07285 [Firmicutes bacterium]|nr:hypothetical protein [Bacillota bacterium]
MRKQRITKDDGRYLIYYSFDDEKEALFDSDGGASQAEALTAHGDTQGCSSCCGKAKAPSSSEGQAR